MEKPEVTMMSRDDFAKLLATADHEHYTIDHAELDLLEQSSLSVPVIKDLDAHVLAAIEAGGKLYQPSWHQYDENQHCGTTHCRGGWAIHLAGAAGYALEDALGSEAAAEFIYLASTGRVPDFYAENEEALEDIRRCAKGGA
jgi:hypothetical protein